MERTSDCKTELTGLWDKLYLFEKKEQIKSSEDLIKKYGFIPAYKMISKINDLENENIFVIDQKPLFQEISKPSKQIKYTHEEIETILKYVTYKVRNVFNNEKIDVLNESLIGECMRASNLAIMFLKYFYVGAYELRSELLFNTDINHSFVLAEFETNDGIEAYIIDLTYRQFCLLSRCNPLRKFHFEYQNVFPGLFIDEDIGSELLKNGYLRLNGINAKAYAESFRENRTDYKDNRYIKCIQMGKKLR